MEGGLWALLRQIVVTSLLAVVAFPLTARILLGMTVDGLASALLAVIFIAVFNAVRSLVLVLVAPFSLILTGWCWSSRSSSFCSARAWCRVCTSPAC